MRGTTLGTVLIVLAVGVLMTLTVFALSMSGRQFFQNVDRSDTAHNLAEAAVAEGLAQVQERENFGMPGLVSRDILISSSMPDSRGFLTFNHRTASQAGMHYSSNCFFSPASQAGDSGRLIPRNCAHLVGLGVCGSVRRQVEALIFRPPFSEGVACAGHVHASNLLLGGLRDPAAFAGSYDLTPSQHKMAGHIFANSPGEAIRLEERSDIRGNVGAVGHIRIRNSRVQGEVHPFNWPRSIPRLELDRIVQTMSRVEGNWSWNGAGASPVRGGGDGSAARPWTGYRVVSTDLNVNGDLCLNGGAVYVKGNVHIRGALKGTGTLVTTGSAFVGAGSLPQRDSNLALCAAGNVTLRGSDKNRDFFQGMVYSEGDIRADDLSFMGALVAPGERPLAPQLGNVYVNNVNIYPCPRQVSVTLGSPFTPMHLRDRPPPDPFSAGSYDALTVRVDVSQERSGENLYSAYLYYAKDLSTDEMRGSRGWTGNADYFHRHQADYQYHGPERDPIVLRDLTAEELLVQLNDVVADINGHTYLADPHSLKPDRPTPHPMELAPSDILARIRTSMEEVSKGEGSQVMEFNLSRRLPREEQYRILLLRELPLD